MRKKYLVYIHQIKTNNLVAKQLNYLYLN